MHVTTCRLLACSSGSSCGAMWVSSLGSAAWGRRRIPLREERSRLEAGPELSKAGSRVARGGRARLPLLHRVLILLPPAGPPLLSCF